jgi:hypothetical protein
MDSTLHRSTPNRSTPKIMFNVLALIAFVQIEELYS